MNLNEKVIPNKDVVLFKEPVKFKKVLKSVVKRYLPKAASHKLHTGYKQMKGFIKPYKGARVYVKKGIERMEFFEILNDRKIEYVLLRWWQNLPEIPPGEDMDILIRDEHRDLISDLITFRDNGTELKCDIYTVEGSKFGSHKSIPYFQSNLSHSLIKDRVLYRGAYVPSPITYFASLAYHAIFHKGDGSGLSGFKAKPTNVEHNYPQILAGQAQSLGLNLDVTVQGLYNWLKEQNFIPAEDTLSKLVEIRPELAVFQQSIYSDIRGGELMVYLVRQRLIEDGLLKDFMFFLENEYNFEIIDTRILNSREKEICKTQIRGGKWDKGPYRYSGGVPEAMVVVFDYNPWPLTSHEMKRQSRMTNRNNLHAKYKFRDRLNELVLLKGHYNGVHSADNELDARSYISLLGKDYHDKIFDIVENRREFKKLNKLKQNSRNG